MRTAPTGEVVTLAAVLLTSLSSTAMGQDDLPHRMSLHEPRPWSATAPQEPKDPGQDDDREELSRKATDPTASLMSLSFITTYTGDFHGSSAGLDDDRWELKFQPGIPFQAFGMPNVLRIVLPYQLDGRGEEGLGDVTVFNLTMVQESWGRWAVGPVMLLSGDDDAPDDFAIGPAIGAVAPVSKGFMLGLFSQNLFWSDTAITQIQPIVTYQVGKGLALSTGDLQFTYDWEGDRWVNLPVGFQVGQVLPLGGHLWRLAINPQYNLADDPGLEEWKVLVTLTLLLPQK